MHDAKEGKKKKTREIGSLKRSPTKFPKAHKRQKNSVRAKSGANTKQNRDGKGSRKTKRKWESVRKRMHGKGGKTKVCEHVRKKIFIGTYL